MKLYICRISDFDDFWGLSVLTEERRKRITNYVQKKDKLRCLCGGLLLHFVFGKMADWIALDTYGKPIIPKEKLHFNLSHSGDYVVLAVDEGEIGIDIEKISSLSNEIVKHCFTKEEQKWLASQPIEHAFYLLWTGKESVMKAIGKGFYMEPKSFSVMPIRDGVHHIDGYNWYLQWYEYDNHVICVTSKTTEREELCFLCRDEIQHKLL